MTTHTMRPLRRAKERGPHAPGLPDGAPAAVNEGPKGVKGWSSLDSDFQVAWWRPRVIIVVNHIADKLLAASVDEPIMAVKGSTPIGEPARPPSAPTQVLAAAQKTE